MTDRVFYIFLIIGLLAGTWFNFAYQGYNPLGGLYGGLVTLIVGLVPHIYRLFSR